MTPRRILIAVVASLALVPVAAVRAGEPKWKQHTINGQSEFEAAGDLRRRQRRQARHRLAATPGIRPPTGRRTTSATSQRPGRITTTSPPCRWTSTATATPISSPVSYFGKNVGWVENPGQAGANWTYHEIDVPGPSEAAWAVDLTGDGVPDILPNVVNSVVWYEVVKKGDGKGVELKKHDFGNAGGRARRRLGRRQRRRPGRHPHPQGLVRGAPPIPSPRPGPGTPSGTWARRASRSSPATSTATASPTSSTAWATTTACSG